MATTPSTRGRTVSGRAVGLFFLLLSVGTVLTVLFLTPAAQRDVLGMLGGVNDRQVLGIGDVAGREVTVVGTLDERTSCVVVSVDGEDGPRACVEGPPAAALDEVVVSGTPEDDRWIAAGITDPSVRLVRLQLDDGAERVLTVNRPRGYEVGFWFADRLDPATAITRIVATDTRDVPLGSRTCRPVLASSDGVGADCATIPG